MPAYVLYLLSGREETEIIEGEVVEIQIDRPATGTVSLCSSPSINQFHWINLSILLPLFFQHQTHLNCLKSLRE